MPQLGPAIGAFLTSATVAATLTNIAISVAINFALARLNRPRAPRPQDQQSEIRQSDADRMRHYGRVRASGVVHFWDWATENDQRYLYKLLAISTGGIDGVEAWWLNDAQVSVSVGDVTSEPYVGYVTLQSRRGAGSELAGGDYANLRTAFPAHWTTDHRLDGVATVLGRFLAPAASKINDLYSGGEPTITVLLRGARVWDPRLGAQTDATTVFSENVALQIFDYLRHSDGANLPEADLIEASFVQAANDADDAIATKDGGTQPRYRGAGSYALSEPKAQVIARMLDACGGRLYRGADGRIGLRVAKWRAPQYTITPDHIISIEGGVGSGGFDQVTTLIPSYVAPELDYQETTADPWENAALIALLGESQPQSLDLPHVPHHGQTRRLAKIADARINPDFSFTVRLRFWGLLLLEEESVALTFPEYGLTDEPFWIDGFAFDPENSDAPVTVRVIHARESTLSWTPATEEGDAPEWPADIDPSQTLPQPVITASGVITVAGGVRLRAMVAPIEGLVVVGGYRAAGETAWISAPADQDTGEVLTPVLSASGSYDLRVGYADSALAGATAEYAQITGLLASVQPVPAAPVITASSVAAGQVSITFEPDVGPAYWRSQVLQGATATTATVIANSTEAADSVTITVPAVVGQNYYLRSMNFERVATPAQFVIGA